MKLNMLQLMGINLVEILVRLQTSKIKTNINVTDKRLGELRELKVPAQESILTDEENMEKVNNCSKELESKLLSHEEKKTEMEASLGN